MLEPRLNEYIKTKFKYDEIKYKPLIPLEKIYNITQEDLHKIQKSYTKKVNIKENINKNCDIKNIVNKLEKYKINKKENKKEYQIGFDVNTETYIKKGDPLRNSDRLENNEIFNHQFNILPTMFTYNEFRPICSKDLNEYYNKSAIGKFSKST
jgi:hypothetical protein